MMTKSDCCKVVLPFADRDDAEAHAVELRKHGYEVLVQDDASEWRPCADCLHCDKVPDGHRASPYDYPNHCWRCRGWRDRLTGEIGNPACSAVRPEAAPCPFFEEAAPDGDE